jgi:hypothetical protein
MGILNVGAGDTKLTFDKNNPAERIRSARIITDMLRRGYALLVEDPPGSGAYTRATAFREDTCEYVIADLDPISAATEDAKPDERNTQPTDEPTTTAADGKVAEETSLATPHIAGGRRRGRPRTVSASETNGIAVSRSAGG